MKMAKASLQEDLRTLKSEQQDWTTTRTDLEKDLRQFTCELSSLIFDEKL